MFHMIVRFIRYFCIVCISLNPLLVNAAMYKWVDENGTTQYSQVPPVGIKTEQVGQPSAPANDPDKLNKDRETKMKAFDKRRLEDKKQAKEAKKAEQDKIKLKEKCDRIQKNMATLTYRNRVFEKQNGKMVTLGADQRDEKLKKYKDEYAKSCK